MNKEQAKEKLKRLIIDFPEHENHNEENLKFNYIEPLLMDILGWDRVDIIKEQRVLKGRADYILKIGNEEVLVIETKRPNVSLNEEEGRQAVSYAYHRKIKFAVLTNFKEIKVYHALSNIKNIDKNLLKFEDGGFFRIPINQFLENFDKLLFLSKESFEKEKINKLLSKKDERLAKTIDKSILDDLLEIRRKLSNDLKHLRMQLTQEQIDEAVQILIDRLIFMRSVEDRGLEPMNFLLGIRKDYREGTLKKRLWEEFLILFKKFDKEYNSKLFANSILESETIFFSDDILQKVIYTLYFGANEDQIRYKFDEIPGDLLGNIYEQYLGTVLQGTEKRVKLESESGKRKKMGIYYTPSYIVDYIVKNTVGEYIKEKTIDEILETKILDPACGSGSFLTRAFQEVANVIEEKLKKGEKSKGHQFSYYKDRLDLGQKSAILERCIHGVDLDEKAVELAQLNLLLKLLEEETQETKRRILPNMRDNIKNGNSLIDDPKVAGDKAFNWPAQFPDIFRNGGFDVIVGNPPYVRIQTLNKKEVNYFNDTYDSPEKNYDIYILFTEKGHKLLKRDGILGFILPHKFFQGENGKNIRQYLYSNKAVERIVDFSTNQIFENASTYTCLFFLSKKENKTFLYKRFDLGSDFRLLNNINFEDKSEEELRKEQWSFSNDNLQKILNNITQSNNRFMDLTEKIFKGSSTGNDRIYLLDLVKDKGHIVIVFSQEMNQSVEIEKEILMPFLYGEDVRRYYISKSKKLLLFPYKKVNNQIRLIPIQDLKDNYPLAFDYLTKVKSKLLERKVDLDSSNFYKYSAGRSLTEYNKPKIMIPDMLIKVRVAYDSEGNYYHGPAVHSVVFNNKTRDLNPLLFLSILNSKVFWFFITRTSTALRGNTYRLTPEFLNHFCFPDIDLTNKEQKKDYNIVIELSDKMLTLQKQLHEGNPTGNEKERLEQQIKNIDYEIDQEVYKLYGLTKEEIKIVEESLK